MRLKECYADYMSFIAKRPWRDNFVLALEISVSFQWRSYAQHIVNINIIEEEIREGKGKALNHALQYASNEIVVTSEIRPFNYEIMLIFIIVSINIPVS